MLGYLLASLLLVPVLLLASPPILFEQKQRRDIAYFYLLALTMVQLVTLLIYWGQAANAATWTIGLIGLATTLSGCYLAFWKQLAAWKLSAIGLVLVNALLLYLAFY